MRRLLLAAALAVGFTGAALANFSDGQNRFNVGDYAGAYAAWLPLAEAGDPRAQYSLGVMHLRGLGRTEDPDGATAWFEKAARQGYAPAVTALKSAGKPAPGDWGAPQTERDRVEQALRDMLGESADELEVGAIRVADAGQGAFDIAIDGIAMEDAQGERLRVGPLAGRATRAADDAWRFEFDAPPPLDGVNARGEPFRIAVGGGRTAAVWNETLQLTTKLEMDWRRLHMETESGPMAAARLIVRSDFVPKEGDRWGGLAEFRLEGLDLTEPGKDIVRLAALFARFDFSGADLARLVRVVKTQDPGNPLGSLAEMRGLFSDVAFEMGVEGFDHEGPQGRRRLGDGAIRFALAKLDKSAFDLEVRYRHAGLDGEFPQAFGDLAPREAQLKVTLAHAPMEAVVQAGIAAGLEYMLTGELTSAPALAENLRKALPAAGTELRLEDGLFRAAKARLTADGAFAADAAAALGVVGAVGVTVSGMDSLLAAAAAPEADGATASLLGALARVGERGPDGATLIYRFELGVDGEALVNGRPLAALFD